MSSSQALTHMYLQWPWLSMAWKLAADGHKNPSSGEKLPCFSRIGQCRKIAGKSQSFPSGRWESPPRPWLPRGHGDALVGPRENRVLSEETAVVVVRQWLCAAQLAATRTEHPGLFQPSLYPLKVGSCFLLLYLQVVWAEFFVAAA